MVDEETEDVSSAPAGVPPNRGARRDPGVIEGEIAAGGADEHEPPPSATTAPESAAQPQPAPAPKRPRTAAFGVLGGAIAGLLISLLTIGGFYSLLAPDEEGTDSANRLAEIQAQEQRENAALETDSAALASLDKRVSALETGAKESGVAELDKRVAALEASAKNEPDAGAAAQAEQTGQQLATEVKDLRADIDAARGEIPALAARVAKLETAPTKTNDADLSAVSARLDKVEAALAAPKSETRVAPEKPAAADNAAPVAIIAGVIADKLAAGAPLGTAIAALQRLGVDPAQLQALQGVADGAPTASALAASFNAIAPRVLAAVSPEDKGSVLERLLAHIRGLVQVRDLGETTGDDPEAIVSRVEAACRRGDIAGALAAFDKLPAPAREAAGDWPAKARARQAADAALQSIREAAIGRLAGDPSR